MGIGGAVWSTLTDTPPEKMARARERYILRTRVQRVAANGDEHFLHPDPDESLPSMPRVRRALERAYQPAYSAQRACAGQHNRIKLKQEAAIA